MSTSSESPVPDAAVPMLRRLVARDDWGRSGPKAARALGWSRAGRETVRALASVVEADGNSELRCAATNALVRIGVTRDEAPALLSPSATL